MEIRWKPGFAELARNAEPTRLVLAALLQLGTYVCAAAVWHRALASQPGHPNLPMLPGLWLARREMGGTLPSESSGREPGSGEPRRTGGS